MVYAGSFNPKQMTTVFEDMRRHTSGVFGANFLIPEAFVSDLDEIREQVETASKLVKVGDSSIANRTLRWLIWCTREVHWLRGRSVRTKRPLPLLRLVAT